MSGARRFCLMTKFFTVCNLIKEVSGKLSSASIKRSAGGTDTS